MRKAHHDKAQIGMVMIRLLLLTAPALLAQGPSPGNRNFHDDLLDQMVGRWSATGAISDGRGGDRTDRQEVFVNWGINHQWLQIHSRQLDGDYESEISIGYDNMTGRYVAHQLDSFGGRASEVVGYGLKTGDQIQFVFTDAQRFTRQTFSWSAKEKTWQFQTDRRDRQGNWSTFITRTLKKEPDGRGSRFGGRGPRSDSLPPDQPAAPSAPKP